MKSQLGLLATLFCALTSAYQPGGLQPIVRSYVNFGQNPFIQDQFNPQGFYQLPGYTGGSVIGNVFTSTSDAPGLFMSSAAIAIPGLGSEIEVKSNMALQAEVLSGLILSPAGIDQDPLYGTAQIGAFDPTQGWLFAIMMTNTRIYALYSRLDIARTAINNYVAFSYLVPIAARSLYASNDLSIVMNKAHFTVSYRVQNLEMLYIERVGGPIDEKFLLADDGGCIQCMGFPDSFHTIIGTGMIPDAGHPYTACQSNSTFDQCQETIIEADFVCCDYQPMQDPATYSVGLTLTVQSFAVLEWAPHFDCQNPCRLDVTNPLDEPLCFNNCPVFPIPLPPVTGCGLYIPNNAYCSSESEIPDCGCPQIYRHCSISTTCTESSSCPLVYRPIERPPARCESSSSEKPCRYRIRQVKPPQHRPCRKSSSSSSLRPVIRRRRHQPRRKPSSSSSHAPWRHERVQWGIRQKSESSSHQPARFQVRPPVTRRSPYCKPKNNAGIEAEEQ